MLSFAVRELHCTAGVMVTASHNPPEYNGYKVYWEDGAQITAPKDVEIINEVQSITDYGALKTMSEEDAKAAGLYEVIGSEIDDKYMEALKKLVLRPEAIKKQADKLKIVYTPLHGTGNLPVRRVLKELGFTQVHVVKEQELPDGDFPTVSYRTRRIKLSLWPSSWPKRWMQISSSLPTRMLTVSAFTQRTRKPASTRALPETCPVC